MSLWLTSEKKMRTDMTLDVLAFGIFLKMADFITSPVPWHELYLRRKSFSLKFLPDMLKRVILKHSHTLNLLTLRLTPKGSTEFNWPAAWPYFVWRAYLQHSPGWIRHRTLIFTPILRVWHLPMLEHTPWLKLKLRWTHRDKNWFS